MKPNDLPYDAHLLETEQKLEQEAVALGAEKYQQMLDSRGEAETGPGKRLLKNLILAMADSLKAFQERALGGTAGKDIAKAKFLLQFKPEDVAYVTAKIAIQYCDNEVTVQRAALEIARLLVDTANVNAFKDENPKTHRYLLERIRKSGNKGTHRHFIIKAAMKRHELVTIAYYNSMEPQITI